jgi:hypothetical protein
MAAYRLEIWFNYSTGAIDWGAAVANAGGNPPFSNGGAAIPRNGSTVSIRGAGNSSTMDIYVFDATGDGVSRDLQWIAVDFEKANQGVGGGRDPVQDASGLRGGITGAAFMGASNGGANGTTQGVGSEDSIFSAPSGTVAQRRWSLNAGFEQLTPGNYTFTVALVVTPRGGGQPFVIDPEMDIQSAP